MAGVNWATNVRARISAVRGGLAAGLLALAALILSPAPSLGAGISASPVTVSKDVLNGSNTGTIGVPSSVDTSPTPAGNPAGMN